MYTFYSITVCNILIRIIKYKGCWTMDNDFIYGQASGGPLPMKTKKARKPSSGPGFWRVFLIVVLSVLLGGLTIGGGIGLGLTIGRGLFQRQANVVYEDPNELLDFTETEITYIPINVKKASFSHIISEVTDSVVSISTRSRDDRFGGQGSGSGFIFAIDDDYVYIATSFHVIENSVGLDVSLDDEEMAPAFIIGTDPPSDMAVIGVAKPDMDALNATYKAAAFGDSSLMQVGDQVVAIGNSMGIGQTVTYGIISALNKQITVEGKNFNVMQTDAAINRGNSGGPLINAKGEVIGINMAKSYSPDVEGMGFCIPINDAADILESLRLHGLVRKSYIGILEIITIDEVLKETFNLPSTGVLARGIDPSSGAGAAGLLPFDLIVGFNDIEINSINELAKAMESVKIGDEIVLAIYRNGELMTFAVTLGELVE